MTRLAQLAARLWRRTRPVSAPPAGPAVGRHRPATPLGTAVARQLDEAPTRLLSRAAIADPPPPRGHWAPPVDEHWAAVSGDHELVRGHVRELHRMQGWS